MAVFMPPFLSEVYPLTATNITNQNAIIKRVELSGIDYYFQSNQTSNVVKDGLISLKDSYLSVGLRGKFFLHLSSSKRH